MSSCDQLQALMTKNFILMKRNVFSTCCEILFPILLMLLLAAVKSLFTITDEALDTTDSKYILSNSSAFPSLNNLSSVLKSGNTTSLLNSTFYDIPIKNGQL